MNWRALLTALAVLAFGSTAWGQIPPPNDPCIISSSYFARSGKVVCTVPQVYGSQGLAFGGDAGPVLGSSDVVGQFSQQDFLLSLNTNVATQIALLPFVTPATGISFTFDKSLGIFKESNDSFGPIFSERASTLGKNRISIGVSYQFVEFDSLDGIDLHNFPTLYIQSSAATSERPCPSTNPFIEAACHDYVTATNRIDLKVHQVTPFVTFGITNKLDVSVAVPLLDVRMGASANATMVENSGESGSTVFSGPACNQQGSGGCGLEASFSNANHAAGLGDITVRVKGTAWESERAGLAIGLDVRIPTGQAMNFLGTGAYGIKPFAVWSHQGRISPHVNLGYQWNGKSVLGADITTGEKSSLPSEFLYSAGLEAGVNKRLTATVDLIGQTVFNAGYDSLTQVMAPGLCSSQGSPALPTCLSVGALTTTITPSTRTYGINNAALGVRYRPFGKFLVSASVLLKLDEGGLRAKAIPVVSATYTFR